jgi:uridine kinase
MTRSALLAKVAERIGDAQQGHTMRVAIDGIDAAGKTTLANELEPLIVARGRPVIRASIDGFHNQRAVRYKRGRLSPKGYFQDSFNLPAVVSSVLEPLGPNSNGHYQVAIFDWQTDRPVEPKPEQAPPGAILLFDGIFLARPELVSFWDLFIFVEINFETCLANALERERTHFNGDDDELPHRYQTRYVPAQREYLAAYRPQDRADIVIDNNDPAAPHLIKFRPPATG